MKNLILIPAFILFLLLTSSDCKTVISKEQLLSNFNVRLYLPDYKSDTTIKLISYDYVWIPKKKKGNLIVGFSKTVTLPDIIVKHIENAKSGDKLIIEKVKIQDSKGDFRRVQGYCAEIK